MSEGYRGFRAKAISDTACTAGMIHHMPDFTIHGQIIGDVKIFNASGILKRVISGKALKRHQNKMFKEGNLSNGNNSFTVIPRDYIKITESVVKDKQSRKNMDNYEAEREERLGY